MTTGVFRLENDADDPRFYGFIFRDQTSLLGRLNIYRDFLGLDSDGRVSRLTPLWAPHEVVGKVLSINDFPTVGNIPAFSERAVGALREFLEPNGELLPLITPGGCGKYYVYNITTVSNALDAGKSDVGVTGNGRHEFIPERLVGHTVFRIAEHPRFSYVTDEFVDRVRQHELGGFLLMKVWPVAPGVNWRRAAKQELEAAKSSGITPKQRAPTAPQHRLPLTLSWRLPMAGEESTSLGEAIAEFEAKLKLNLLGSPPDQAQALVSKTLEAVRASNMTPDEKVDRAFWLAIGWGQLVVVRLGWQWVILEDGKGAKTIAVASPNKSHALPVIQYMERLATDPNSELTTELLYNMIVANALPPAKPEELRLIG